MDWKRSFDATFALADEVHVWRLELDLSPARAAEVSACLSADERQRAGRFAKPADRDRHSAAHGGLRRLLGRYLAVEPAGLAFRFGPHGKPAVADPPFDLRFNLSHSEGVGLVAVAVGREVGVDVERVRDQPPEEGVAEMAFGPTELAAWRALPAERRPAAFYRLWTRREAWLKARGVGLSGLDRPPIDLGEVGLSGWPIVDLPAIPDFAAALCVEGDKFAVTCLYGGA